MLFLSAEEKRLWAGFGEAILCDDPVPGFCNQEIRENLIPAFCFYAATLLAARGHIGRSIAWLEEGSPLEENELICCRYLLGYLKRHGGLLAPPAQVFRDPLPVAHFTGVPVMKEARRQFVRHCGHTLPEFDEPVRFVDIGCGDGSLTVDVLSNIVGSGKVPEICEVLLVDSSPEMASLAEKAVRSAFPLSAVRVENGRIQECSLKIDRRFDIAMSSFAYHHLPVEEKRIDLARLKPWIDHFLLFELDANNDTPALHSPDLALAVYQSYGRIFRFHFTPDTDDDIAILHIDSFLMTELISFFTEPRGTRSDYHMLRSQWHALFSEVLGAGFSPGCDSPCYSDEYIEIFTLHYGRNR